MFTDDEFFGTENVQLLSSINQSMEGIRKLLLWGVCALLWGFLLGLWV